MRIFQTVSRRRILGSSLAARNTQATAKLAHMGDVRAAERLLACIGLQSRESEGGALVVIDEQERTRMDTEELEREQAVLLPDRMEMRRHRRRRRPPKVTGPI